MLKTSEVKLRRPKQRVSTLHAGAALSVPTLHTPHMSLRSERISWTYTKSLETRACTVERLCERLTLQRTACFPRRHMLWHRGELASNHCQSERLSSCRNWVGNCSCLTLCVNFTHASAFYNSACTTLWTRAWPKSRSCKVGVVGMASYSYRTTVLRFMELRPHVLVHPFFRQLYPVAPAR